MLDEWEIPSDELGIHTDNMIGSGEFGRIFTATWRGIQVAVKEFHDLDDHKTRLMKNEFHVMTRLHHPNIIQLLGYTTEPFRIVMEHMPGGDLKNYLRTCPRVSLRTRITMALDIACGLCYLHRRKPSYVIHRDIKPNNFLLTKDLRVKISDFGICKILQNLEAKRSQENMSRAQEIDGTANVGTLFYMAPELVLHRLERSTRYSAAIDIYSFGAVMYFMFERETLYGWCETREELTSCLLRHEYPDFTRSPSIIRDLILRCLDHRPSCRPTADEIVHELDSFLSSYPSYLWCF
ncbi:hypothetical protein EBZ80_02365 [bacterium]|nr:hypothetical protein [bacterium]